MGLWEPEVRAPPESGQAPSEAQELQTAGQEAEREGRAAENIDPRLLGELI